MKNIDRVIVSLVYYNSLIRDCLEYTIHRDNFDVNFYNYKKNGIVNEPLKNTPLNFLLNNNGEVGENLRKDLTEFANYFFGDNTTVLRVEGDTVKVDHNQDIQIFEKVIPLHERLNGLIVAHDNERSKEGELEPLVTNLRRADERFYRAVALFTLFSAFNVKFREFQNLMRENKGERGPASNYVEQELSSLVKNFRIVKANAKTNDNDFVDAMDSLDHLIEMMSGRRQLPQGKNFGDIFQEVNQKLTAYLITCEKEWNETFKPAVDEMLKANEELRKELEAKNNEQA